ncbi:single-stranded DNA-binding protein [Candidatus Peregrinibacteria bacterium]|nr:single-stranded DNA-binding protein [Candidatus Peregrinibacteria bacterium]
MKSINRVTLLGHLAADPELISFDGGKKKASFSVATDIRWKGDDGTDRKQTDFHRISAWNSLANICSKYLKKGSAVFVSGKLRNRSYEGKDGKTKYMTEVSADELSILTWKKSKGENELAIESATGVVEHEEEGEAVAAA